MKNFSKFTLAAALAASAFLVTLSAPAIPQPAGVAIQGVTNATTFSPTNIDLAIAGSGTATVSSLPFVLYRGRGYTFHASFVATNANANETVTFNIRYATVKGGATNWSTCNNSALAFTLNGTTRQYVITNVPPTCVDNVQLGQLYTIANGHTNTITVNGTNTFVGIIP